MVIRIDGCIEFATDWRNFIVLSSSGSPSSWFLDSSVITMTVPSYLAPFSVCFVATFESSTYRSCSLSLMPIRSSFPVYCLSHHTINTCATTPVSSMPIAPPFVCLLTTPANSYVCVSSNVFNTTRIASTIILRRRSSPMSAWLGNNHGLCRSSSFSVVPHPVIFGRGPLRFRRLGHPSCMPLSCNSSSFMTRLRYNPSSLRFSPSYFT